MLLATLFRACIIFNIEIFMLMMRGLACWCCTRLMRGAGGCWCANRLEVGTRLINGGPKIFHGMLLFRGFWEARFE